VVNWNEEVRMKNEESFSPILHPYFKGQVEKNIEKLVR